MAGNTFEVRMAGDPAAQLKKLARDLKQAGRTDLRKELLVAGRQLKTPFKEAVESAASQHLPSKGGLNEWVAGRIKVTATTKLTGKDVGVRFKTKHRGKNGLSDLPAINRGRVRHPLYGMTDHWFTTEVEPGFMKVALDEMGDTARDEFLKAVDQVLGKFAAGG